MIETPNPADIFKGTAWYYARYRRPYPEQALKDLVDYYRLDRAGRLLDLGCGTGELTVPLAPYFSDAIGVDPNSEMLAQAKERAVRAGVRTIKWRQERAEDTPVSLGPVRLTVAGVSFHWMDQPVVLGRIYALTGRNGGMAIIADNSPVRGADKTETWRMKRKELIVKYLGERRRAGDHLHRDFIPNKPQYEDLITASPFKTFELREYPYTTERNIEEVLGFLYSTSYANRRLFRERVDEFEHELTHELLKLVPSGKFVEEGNTRVFFMRH